MDPQFGAVCIAPESPVWLLDQGHCGAARKLRSELWGSQAANLLDEDQQNGLRSTAAIACAAEPLLLVNEVPL